MSVNSLSVPPDLPDVVTWAIPAFVVLILVELVGIRMGWFRGHYEKRDMAASLLMGLGNVISKTLFGFVGLAGLVFAWEHRVFDPGWTWWAWVLCFFGEDLAYYWNHRLGHERRWFWASHVVHHSSQHYNLSTALRQTWTGIFSLGFIFWMPLAFLGLHPVMIAFFSGVSLVYQFWIHTESVRRLGPLEWVLNTPSHHRVHHAVNPHYLDANYAGVLIIWDRIFGTFVGEDEKNPPVYGIIANLGAFNPLRIAFHEWAGIWRDWRRARNAREILLYAFGAPGWSPDGSRLTTRAIKAGARAKDAESADRAASPAE